MKKKYIFNNQAGISSPIPRRDIRWSGNGAKGWCPFPLSECTPCPYEECGSSARHSGSIARPEKDHIHGQASAGAHSGPSVRGDSAGHFQHSGSGANAEQSNEFPHEISLRRSIESCGWKPIFRQD